MEIHEKIRELRQKRRLRQVEIAELIGIKQSTYSLIEDGKTKNISLNVAIGIAKALDVSFNELFDIEYKPEDTQIIEKYLKENTELKETVQKNNQLIELLQHKNQELQKAKAGLELREEFRLYYETDQKIKKSKSESDKEKLTNYQRDINKPFVRKKLDEIIRSGIFSRYELFELFFEYDPIVDEICKSSTNLNEELNRHLSQFINILPEESALLADNYEAWSSRSG
ncbi:MAG: helix-turn-helix transcriptional regulator [Candidatus Muiribacteriota bacterium]